MLILNWYKYNWSKSEKTLVGVENVAKHIKCKEFKSYVYTIIENIRNGVFDMPHICTIQASVSDTDTDSVSDSITDIKYKDIDIIKNIIDYFNSVCGTRYKHTTDKTKTHIKARLREGFNLEDFMVVIDKKSKEWIGTDMEKFLRPETLFGTKFEGYLNQTIVDNPIKKQNKGTKWE